MSTARANLETVISADMSQYSATMRKAGMVAQATAGKIGKSMANAAANLTRAGTAATGLATVLAGAALVRGIKNAADLGGKLADLSARTSIAAGDLAVLGRAFEDNGVSADKIGATINKLQKAIVDFGAGSETAAKPFNALGIAFSEISALSPAKQFALIQQKIAGIADPAQRAAVAMQLFGKSGGEMLTLFADSGALGKAGEFLGTQAEILNRRAATFDEISDILARAGAKLQGFTVGVLDAIADKLLPALQHFDKMDLAAMGQRFGAALSDAVGSSEDILENFTQTGERIAFMVDGLYKFGQVFKRIGETIGTALGAIASPVYWEGLGDLISVKIGRALQNILPDGFLSEKLLKGLDRLESEGIEKMRPFMEGLEGLFRPIESLKDTFAAIGDSPTFKALVKGPVNGSIGASVGGLINGANVGRPTPSPFTPEVENLVFRPAPSPAAKAPGVDIFGPSKSLADQKTLAMIQKRNEAGASGFRGLSSLYGMQADRMIGKPLGGDNIFAKDRSRLGIIDGTHTGGLGEKRRLKTSRDDKDAKRNLSIQERQVTHLDNIDRAIGKSLTAS